MSVSNALFNIPNPPRGPPACSYVNPDGRDRYVNWFNSVVGKTYNPDPSSREHSEPWPGGRSNHYNFDLNRDWAWQTQVESQQRMKKYNQWMPHVHVDFHEQGINGPYYFAPAADPYHEVVTQWQKDFQLMIGKNNAAYFDKNSWLFYTKERYDLLYPSYGDTYPIYNGAIGMIHGSTSTYPGFGERLEVHGRYGSAIVEADRFTRAAKNQSSVSSRDNVRRSMFHDAMGRCRNDFQFDELSSNGTDCT